MTKRLSTVQLCASVALVAGIASIAGADTSVSAWSKTIDRLGKRVLCVCRDGGYVDGKAGTIQSTGWVDPPGAVSLGCIVPRFDAVGANYASDACYTYDLIN